MPECCAAAGRVSSLEDLDALIDSLPTYNACERLPVGGKPGGKE